MHIVQFRDEADKRRVGIVAEDRIVVLSKVTRYPRPRSIGHQGRVSDWQPPRRNSPARKARIMRPLSKRNASWPRSIILIPRTAS